MPLNRTTNGASLVVVSMSYFALLAKGEPPAPLSTGEAILGVALVLAGIVLALAIAIARCWSDRL